MLLMMTISQKPLKRNKPRANKLSLPLTKLKKHQKKKKD